MSGMPPVRCVASDLKPAQLALLRQAIERHDPTLAWILVDADHDLTPDESAQLVIAVGHELTLNDTGELDAHGLAVDDLIDRINLGPYVR